MKPEIELMHAAWREQHAVGMTTKSPVNLQHFTDNILAVGPYYFYLVDFTDYGPSNPGKIYFITDSVQRIHGIEKDNFQSINDVLALIHPDDMEYVAHAEASSLEYHYSILGGKKIVHYKTSYNFRMRVHGGQYKLFNHQALVLSIDENGQFCQSLNIHTRIDHLTEKNNYKLSLISLKDSPSFLDIEVMPERNTTIKGNAEGNVFSPRETEIIQLLQQGEDSKSIAEKLFLSTETVKTHRRNILRKSGCKSTPELIAKLTSSGLI